MAWAIVMAIILCFLYPPLFLLFVIILSFSQNIFIGFLVTAIIGIVIFFYVEEIKIGNKDLVSFFRDKTTEKAVKVEKYK